jgi:hypothetical protein
LRQPTSDADAYAWWSNALKGDVGQITTEPRCGYFKTKLVRGGPWVPVRIFLVQVLDQDGLLIEDERYEARVNGKRRDAEDAWIRCADHPIDRDEFRFMCATAEWAEKHSPRDPAANPKRPIDPVFQPLHTFGSTRGRKS